MLSPCVRRVLVAGKLRTSAPALFCDFVLFSSLYLALVSCEDRCKFCVILAFRTSSL